MHDINTARKPGARTLAEIETELREWFWQAAGGKPGVLFDLNKSPHMPIGIEECWPVRDILIELLEGHGIDCTGERGR